MKKIEQLTAEQKALQDIYRDKWIDIGLSTRPADREGAEKGINLMYEIVGLEKPKQIIWCDSPLTAFLTKYIIEKISKDRKIGDSVRDSVWNSVWASVRDSVWNSVWASVRASVRDSVGDSVRNSVWDSVRDSVGDSVWDSVRDPVWDSVRDSVWDSVGDSVGDSVRNSVWDSVRDSVGDSVYGQHDAPWLGFYDYFKEICKLDEQTKKLEGLWILAKTAGWAMPYKEICFVCERHNIVKKDDQNRLHCEDGMAVQFPDKWGVYAWHGVRVSEWIILNPEKITIDLINKEQNAEIRRVMCERYGWEKYFKDRISNGICKLLDEKTVWGQPVRLFCDKDGEVDRHFIHVINGTEEKDGTRHQFIINCKNIENCAEKSVFGTYPELLEDIKKFYPNWSGYDILKELRASVRT